jgi:hypothetical protein
MTVRYSVVIPLMLRHISPGSSSSPEARESPDSVLFSARVRASSPKGNAYSCGAYSYFLYVTG